MDQHDADADHLARLNAAQKGIAQEIAAEALPLPASVDREAPWYQGRDRVGRVAPRARRRRSSRHGARRKGVVADHRVAFTNDERARGPARLVAQRAPSEPIVERGLRAGKLGKVVGIREWRWRAERAGRCAGAHRSQAGVRFISAASFGFSAGGASSAATKAAQASSSR